MIIEIDVIGLTIGDHSFGPLRCPSGLVVAWSPRVVQGVVQKKRPWISLEMALAQGFRHAANIRPLRTSEEAQRRSALVEQAEGALKHSRFWFAQLALIQALALLFLPDDPDEKIHTRGHGSDLSGLVRYWLRIAGTGFADVEHRSGHRNHPLVSRAAGLAHDALLTRKPSRYCWIDESGTIDKVGSEQHAGKLHEHRLWILPSAGWSGLTPQAQQLLGDVALMLNLAERGGSASWREERLSRADRPDLPPCLTHDPSSLDVMRTVDSAKVSEPGSNCHDSCPFRLCPYPPVGEKPYRSDLSEGFCRKLSRTRVHRGLQVSTAILKSPLVAGECPHLWPCQVMTDSWWLVCGLRAFGTIRLR